MMSWLMAIPEEEFGDYFQKWKEPFDKYNDPRRVIWMELVSMFLEGYFFSFIVLMNQQ